MKIFTQAATAAKGAFREIKKAFGFRGYKEASAISGPYMDWAMSWLTEDGDIYQNIQKLISRSRDLWKESEYLRKFAKELTANVFGAKGILLKMKITEDVDRVVKNPKEKRFWNEMETRRMRVNSYHERHGAAHRIGEMFTRGAGGEMVIKAGQPDLYARKVIQDSWEDWQRREYCSLNKRMSYQEIRRLRLQQTARDGSVFIRLIQNPKVNKYGFAIQLIKADYINFQYNENRLANGNEVKMGIEFNEWGQIEAYWIIVRAPGDWMFSSPTFGGGYGMKMQRVEASEIIHYATFDDSDQTRGVPWITSVIGKLRQLGKYEEAEVVAARVAACKMAFFYSTQGGDATEVGQPDPSGNFNTMQAEPGSFMGLPWGVEVKEWNPNHPNGNYEGFRKGVLRGIAAGLGNNYNILANDLEGVNYSSLRGGLLDERELWMQLQEFDIDLAERPIFEAFLYMGLITGTIPLPLSKFDKFNNPFFQGRRWQWVDPLKDVQADAIALDQMINSRTRIVGEAGGVFEEILDELTEEKMMIEERGMTVPTFGQGGAPQTTLMDTDDDEDEDKKKPKKVDG